MSKLIKCIDCKHYAEDIEGITHACLALWDGEMMVINIFNPQRRIKCNAFEPKEERR